MWQPRPGAIVVGVDGSAAALSAVRWAARDAALRNLPLTLVHVVDADLPEWFEEATLVGPRRWQKRPARDLIESAIKVAEQSTRECGPVEIESRVFHSATVPTLVAISTGGGNARGRVPGTWRRARPQLPGSVSSALVYHAHCPVAVIHDDEAMIGNAAWAPVLVGIDGSPASEAATAIAFEEAFRRGVGLMALHAWVDLRVTDSTRLLQDSKWDAQLSEEEETLAERLAGWHERYPDAGIHRLRRNW